MSIYYEDDHVTLYHGDSLALLDRLPTSDAIITDPPYSDNTHSNAKSNKGKGYPTKAINFAALDDPRELFALLAPKTRRWIVSNLDYKHAFLLDNDPPEALRVLRVGVWVKTNPMPQISADRPATGWEAIAYMHREDVNPHWNGGGKAGNYTLPLAQQTGHPTAKPLSMVADWVRLFTEPGDLVLDPFAGSGTTLRAAKDEGRKAIGVELEERYCEIAAQRLSQDVLDLEGLTA